jgi:outer membrane protein TolC
MSNSGVRSEGRPGEDGTSAARAGGIGWRRDGLHRSLRRARTVGRAAGLCAIALAVASCTPPQPAPFDPHTFDRSARAAATELQESRPKTALPTTLQSTSVQRLQFGTVDPNAPIVRLTLQEVIQRAAANNKEARVAGYEPAIEETRQVEAEARFDPAAFLNGTYEVNRLLSPGASGIQPSPFSPREFRTLSGQAGIRQLLPTGAQAEWSYRLQDIQANTPFTFTPPGTGSKTINFQNYYLSELMLKVTQPLLRDFGTDVNRARITISANTRRASMLEFRRTLEEQLFNTEQAYWQLVQAENDVRIQQDLLERSIDTYRILESRFVNGLDVSRVQVSQAASFVESQRSVLLLAQRRVGDLSDQLKRFMDDETFPVAGSVIVLPADSPIMEQIQFDLADQIDTAMDNRPELGQQLARIRTAEITEVVGRNNLLPQLNFTGSVSFQGVGLNTGQAIKDQRQWENLSSSVGLEFEIPIGNRAARAIYRRVQLQRLQAITQYKNLIDQVQQEVKTSLREVNTTWDSLVQRRQARFAAADSLLAIQQRAEAGEALTPTFVQLQLDAQERLARAQAEESISMSDYNIAISRLERSKGTLLRYYNVVLQEDALPGGR